MLNIFKIFGAYVLWVNQSVCTALLGILLDQELASAIVYGFIWGLICIKHITYYNLISRFWPQNLAATDT